jgi:hypothetical protein
MKTLGAPRVGTGEGNRLNLMNMGMAAVTFCCYRVLCDFVSVYIIDLIIKISKYTALSVLPKINLKLVRLM